MKTFRFVLVVLGVLLALSLINDVYPIIETNSVSTFLNKENIKRKTLKEIYKALERLGVKYPRVFLAQYILESNYGKSRIYRENNNGWGLKVPKYRETTAVGENLGHAKFESIGDAALDYIKRQDYWIPIFERNYFKIESEQDYLCFLEKTGYAEDPNYTNKLRNIIKRLKSMED